MLAAFSFSNSLLFLLAGSKCVSLQWRILLVGRGSEIKLLWSDFVASGFLGLDMINIYEVLDERMKCQRHWHCQPFHSNSYEWAIYFLLQLVSQDPSLAPVVFFLSPVDFCGRTLLATSHHFPGQYASIAPGHLSLTVFWLRKNSWTFLFPGYLWISFVTQPLLFRHVCKFGVRSDNTHPPSLRTFAFSECPVEKNLLTNLIRRSFSAPVLLYPTGALQELPFFCRESQDDIAFAKLSNSL